MQPCTVTILHSLRLELRGKQAIILLSLPCISPLKVLTHNPSFSIPSVLSSCQAALRSLAVVDSTGVLCFLSALWSLQPWMSRGESQQKETAKEQPLHHGTYLFITSLWQSLSRWLKICLCFQPANSPSRQLRDPVLCPAGL